MIQGVKIVKRHLSIYFQLFFILVSTGTGCVPISTSASLVCIPVGITRSIVVKNIYTITEGIKNYKSIKKKKKRQSMIKLYCSEKIS